MDKAATEEKLRARARRHIARRTILAHDVCANVGQMLDNVGHMKWLEDAIMEELRKG